MTFYSAFALCDSIILLISVILTEILGGAGFLVGFLFGGYLCGKYNSQQIRRMCHGMRIVFRNKCPGTNPPRTFLFTKKREEAMDQQNLTVEAVPVVAVEHDIPHSQPSFKSFDS